MALDQVTAVEGIPADRWTAPKHFDQLTPMFPTERIILENLAGAARRRCARLISSPRSGAVSAA